MELMICCMYNYSTIIDTGGWMSSMLVNEEYIPPRTSSYDAMLRKSLQK